MKYAPRIIYPGFVCEHVDGSAPLHPLDTFQLGGATLCSRCLCHELASAESVRMQQAATASEEKQQQRNDADSLAMLRREGPLRSAVQRLRSGVASQREIASWPGMTRDRTVRLLNALYLQAGLIVSRSHPAALGDSWFGGI